MISQLITISASRFVTKNCSDSPHVFTRTIVHTGSGVDAVQLGPAIGWSSLTAALAPCLRHLTLKGDSGEYVRVCSYVYMCVRACPLVGPTSPQHSLLASGISHSRGTAVGMCVCMYVHVCASAQGYVGDWAHMCCSFCMTSKEKEKLHGQWKFFLTSIRKGATLVPGTPPPII